MKVRHLRQQLFQAGFALLPKRGKGSHQVWQHHSSRIMVIQSGHDGKDARPYQVKAVRSALKKINHYYHS